MAVYRISRTLPNGWRIRLDLLPYDGVLGDAVTEMPAVCLVELGDQVSEFDELPFGLQKPQTLKFSLDWDNLPSAVKTYLKNGTSGNDRNTWLLFSDRGTAGATYTLEYCGVEDNIDALELEPGEVGYEYSVELVDICYFTLKTLTGNDVWSSDNYAAQNTDDKVALYDALITNAEGRNQFDSNGGLGMLTSSFEHMMQRLRTVASNKMNGDYVRTANAVTTNFDTGDYLPDIIDAACVFTAQTTTMPRATGSALTSSTALFITHVTTGVDTDVIGGLASSADKYGWARADTTAWDVLKDLSEDFAAKVSYSFRYDVTTPSQPFVKIDWWVNRISGAYSTLPTVDSVNDTIALTEALGRPKISVRGNNVLKGETRIETESSENVQEWVYMLNAAKSSRSINVEPIVHNNPTWKDPANANSVSGFSGPLTTTNVICSDGGAGVLLRAHESMTIHYGPSGTHFVATSSTASATTPYYDEGDAYRATIAAIQSQTGLPYTLTRLYVTAFSSSQSGTIEIEWDYSRYSSFPWHLPMYLGARYAFTGGAADTFDNLAWGNALVTSTTVNWYEGISKSTYYLMDLP